MTEFEKLVIQKLDTMQGDISDLKTDVSDMKEDISTLKSEMSDVKEDISTLKSEMSDVKEDISTLKSEMSDMQNDITALKRTSIKVEMELIPKTQLMLDSYMSIAEKVNISEDLKEEVRTLRFEVDLIKQVIQSKI